MHTPGRNRIADASILFFLLFGLTLTMHAQNNDSAGRRVNSATDNTKKADIERRMEAYDRLNSFNRKAEPKPAAAGLILSEELLTAAEKKLLQPLAEDRQTHGAFLKQSRTGIFKLLQPATSLSVSANASEVGPLPLVGGGAFYSFTKQRHDMDRWAEIRLMKNSLETGFAGLSMGLICRLGDIPLADISLDTPAVAFLRKLSPQTNLEKAEKQFHIYQSGFWFEGNHYKSSQPADVDSTYLLRSMNYGRVDVLIAFRIIRADEDGSLHIIWKALHSNNKISLADLKPTDRS